MLAVHLLCGFGISIRDFEAIEILPIYLSKKQIENDLLV